MSNDSTTAIATLGGGCFWCLDAVFLELQGVTRVTSGYAGGKIANPTYRQVCEGNTGHAEVVQVEYQPSEISYADLLKVFFAIHDPTTRNRQGADVGTQYRSIILTHTPEQQATAEKVRAELEAAKIFDDPIVTEIEPLTTFYPGEEYHQDYLRRNPTQPYCMAVVAPKVSKFRKQFLDMLRKDRARA